MLNEALPHAIARGSTPSFTVLQQAQPTGLLTGECPDDSEHAAAGPPPYALPITSTQRGSQYKAREFNAIGTFAKKSSDSTDLASPLHEDSTNPAAG